MTEEDTAVLKAIQITRGLRKCHVRFCIDVCMHICMVVYTLNTLKKKITMFEKYGQKIMGKKWLFLMNIGY